MVKCTRLSLLAGGVVGCLALTLGGCGGSSSGAVDSSMNSPAAAETNSESQTADQGTQPVPGEMPASDAPPATTTPTTPESSAMADADRPADSPDATAKTTDPAATADADRNNRAAADAPVTEKVDPVSQVYVCEDDLVVATKPGKCQICRVVLSATTLANPDPQVCPVDGNKIDNQYFGLVEHKAYVFDSPNCVWEMRKNPEKYLEEAKRRAATADNS